MEEIKIEPFVIFGNGQCPSCGGEIIVADTETTIMMLDKEGNPISLDTNIQCRGICGQCRRKLNMIRFNGAYAPDTWYMRILKDENDKKAAQPIYLKENPFI